MRKHAGVVLVALGVVLVLPSLWGGVHWDDHRIEQHLATWLTGTTDQPWWDVYNLEAPDLRRRFGGVVPWWTADDLFVRFFRPVSAATHLLDHVLWPKNVMAQHAHNIAWFAALVFAASRLYRAMLPRRVAIVGAAIYAMSYVHAAPVGWIANRNAVIAGVFGLLAVHAYVRWRRPGASRLSGAPVLVMLSLLSAEAGIACLGFVFAYELTQGRAHRAGRGWKLVTVLAVVAIWRLSYDLGGFGAHAGGGYIDPLASPWVFAKAAPGRFGWLLALLLTPLRIAAADGLPLVLIGALAIVMAGAALCVAREALRPRMRLWITASLLALLPSLAAAPGERLLTFAAAGVSPIIAVALVDPPTWSRFARGTAAVVGFTYGVVSPIMLVIGVHDRSYSFGPGRSAPELAVSDAAIRGRNVFVLHSPGQAHVSLMLRMRAVGGRVLPSFTWNLFPTESPPEIERRDCCTLVLADAQGMSRLPFVTYFRGPDRPLSVGDRVETLAFVAEVERVTSSGVPSAVSFTLHEPLESNRNLFVTWNGHDFVRVAPPRRFNR